VENPQFGTDNQVEKETMGFLLRRCLTEKTKAIDDGCRNPNQTCRSTVNDGGSGRRLNTTFLETNINERGCRSHNPNCGI